MNKKEYWQDYYKKNREVILLKKKVRRLKGNATPRPKRQNFWKRGIVWVVTDGNSFATTQDLQSIMMFTTKAQAQKFIDAQMQERITVYPLEVFYKYKIGEQTMLGDNYG